LSIKEKKTSGPYCPLLKERNNKKTVGKKEETKQMSIGG